MSLENQLRKMKSDIVGLQQRIIEAIDKADEVENTSKEYFINNQYIIGDTARDVPVIHCCSEQEPIVALDDFDGNLEGCGVISGTYMLFYPMMHRGSNVYMKCKQVSESGQLSWAWALVQDSNDTSPLFKNFRLF